MAMQNACKEKQSIPEDENTSLHDIDFTELKSLHTTYHNADNDLKRGHLWNNTGFLTSPRIRANL